MRSTSGKGGVGGELKRVEGGAAGGRGRAGMGRVQGRQWEEG